MVPSIEQDYSLLLGYSIFYKENYLTGFNHQKNATQLRFGMERIVDAFTKPGPTGRMMRYFLRLCVQKQYLLALDPEMYQDLIAK